MTKTNAGNDYQARVMGGDIVGEAGTATSATATTLTKTAAGWTVNAWTGHVVVVAGVYGLIISNTATVLTVDRWYAPATPGGTAGTTPASFSYVIMPGGPPAWYMGLTAAAGTGSVTDTALASEITTAGGGLIRKISAYAHTTAAASYTLTAAFTANGSDSLPVTVHRIGVFDSLTSGNLVFQTVPNADATLSASGDQVTYTETVTT